MMKCTMYAYGTSPHLSQIYTGFSLLAANGEIRLIQKLHQYCQAGNKLMRSYGPLELGGVFVVLNDKKVLFYDLSDGSDLRSDVLETADFYFKRSYVGAVIPDRFKSIVHPQGLNYEVYTGKCIPHEVSRFLLRRTVFDKFPMELIKRVAELGSLSFLPTINNMYSPPKPHQEPRVLFMARAWDPESEPPGLSAEAKAERVEINEMRARCIELLRNQLGHYFCGGFAQTKYAFDNYKNLLLKNVWMSGKKNYLSVLQQYPICIATTGLHGSIGWKMGEYVAFSKAIVSERLNCEVPCGFKANKNYLEFDSPELCLQQAIKLLEDSQCRQELMENNWNYYKAYLKPDRLVLRTLNIASASS